jgi:hypothetical protein
MKRDEFARWLANGVLKLIASRQYVRNLEATYMAGMVVWRHPELQQEVINRLDPMWQVFDEVGRKRAQEDQ